MEELNTLEKICLPIAAASTLTIPILEQVAGKDINQISYAPYIALTAAVTVAISAMGPIYRESRNNGEIPFFSDLKNIYKDIKKYGGK